MDRLYREAQESTRSTTATEQVGEANVALRRAEWEPRVSKLQPTGPIKSLTRKMVMKADLCQKVLEGHINAINLD